MTNFTDAQDVIVAVLVVGAFAAGFRWRGAWDKQRIAELKLTIEQASADGTLVEAHAEENNNA